MSREIIPSFKDPERRNTFMKKVLADLESLKVLFDKNHFEKDVLRIGAEQELHFIDQRYEPVSIASEVMKKLKDPQLTSEYARFNLEINAKPLELDGNAFGKLEENLRRKIKDINSVAKDYDAQALITGILPTLRRKHMQRDNLSPGPRFEVMLDLVNESRGSDYEFHIEGEDKLITRENPVVFGGAFTSFQVHLQIDPDKAAQLYNWAQVISAPVLASCTNSPLFLNKKLWYETRVALFPQTADTRKPYNNPEAEKPRVFFGDSWVDEHIIEVFRRDVADFVPLVSTQIDESSKELIQEGKIPRLEALDFFNGSLYRWNRPCYGVTEGRPHIRLENRYIPAGPTLKDEIATATFWVGLLLGMNDDFDNVKDRMDFNAARANFFKVAKHGLGVNLHWLDDRHVRTKELLLEEMLPLARLGLERFNSEEMSDYLDLIEERIYTDNTGAHWILHSFDKVRHDRSDQEACMRMVRYMSEHQLENSPGHKWKVINPEDHIFTIDKETTISRAMTAQVHKADENDLAELALKTMKWRDIAHLPVVDEEGIPVGMVTRNKVFEHSMEGLDFSSLKVKDIMTPLNRSFHPEDKLEDAAKFMSKAECGGVTILSQNKIIGILTKHDILRFAEEIFHEKEKPES